MHDRALTGGVMDATLVLRRLDALAACSSEQGAITRLFLTPAHADAVAMVRDWMRQAGLATRLDAAGTLVGRRDGPTGAPTLLLGSHIDSVRDAGRYDGCLGVAVAVAVAASLRDVALPYALEIRAFGDEEGVRFPVTLTGAHATAGHFDPAWLELRDADGVTLGEALGAFGLDPIGVEHCRVADAFAYLEVHIEQGPVLETMGVPLGVVTGIAAAMRIAVTVTGQAGHAGTVPMDQRQDALVAAAAMVLVVRDVARACVGVVGTVGQLQVSPGAANVVPGKCAFMIDLRAPEDATRDEAAMRIEAELRAIGVREGVTVTLRTMHRAAAVPCDARLQAALAACIPGVAPHIASGAGHDAMAVAALCPVGMLFVRCRGGISHHPDESVTEADVAAALQVLRAVLLALDPATFAAPAVVAPTGWRD